MADITKEDVIEFIANMTVLCFRSRACCRNGCRPWGDRWRSGGRKDRI